MKTRAKGLAALATALVVGVSVFAQQQSQGARPQQQPSQQHGDHTKMSMGDMMKKCREHCQATTGSIDQTQAAMARARQSNDPAQMRAALEEGEKSLAGMKEHMSTCMGMMDMMKNMHGHMGGQMKSKGTQSRPKSRN